MGRSVAETQGIKVETESFYVPERSAPGKNLFFFAYKIRITNLGEEPAQLITRHWIIMDGEGDVQEVKGPGVVGETPRLEPGESFEYQSACPLTTQLGAMRGTYQFMRDDGRSFDAEVAEFSLELPHSIN